MQEILENIKENVKDFVKENSKLTIAIISLFVFLCISAVFVLIFHGKSKNSKKIELPKETFTKREEFIQPSQPSLTNDYYFSRITEESWTDEEADRWFSIPNESNIDELGKANDIIINKITEAAP